MTPADRCSEAAASLVRAYQTIGLPAFVLFVRDSGHVTTIAPKLPAKAVAAMLRQAADAYLEQANGPAVN